MKKETLEQAQVLQTKINEYEELLLSADRGTKTSMDWGIPSKEVLKVSMTKGDFVYKTSNYPEINVIISDRVNEFLNLVVHDVKNKLAEYISELESL